VLTIVNGHQKGRTATIALGQSLTIGRAVGNELVVLDSKASRSHCSIVTTPEGFVLTDLNSTNGTTVNGVRATRVLLRGGETIQIGSTRILFEVVETKGRKSGRVTAALAIFCGVAGGLALVGGVGLVAATRAANRPAVITINSAPSGALVSVDNRLVGTTPVRALQLPKGTHSVRIERASYQRVLTQLDVKNPREDFSFKLQPIHRGILKLDAEPAGVRVYLDGLDMGRTPLVLRDISPGQHVLKLDHPERVPYEEKITVKPNEETSLSIKLLPKSAAFYQNAIKKEPNNLSYHSELLSILVIDHRFDEAGRYLAKALDIVATGRDTSGYFPRFKWTIDKIYGRDPLLNYGDAATVERARNMVNETFEAAIDRHPGYYEFYNWLAGLYQFSGKLDKALVLARRASQAFPANPEVQLQAANFFVAAGRLTDAIQILGAAYPRLTSNFSIVNTLGQFYARSYQETKDQKARELAVKYLNESLALTQDAGAKAATQAKIKEIGG